MYDSSGGVLALAAALALMATSSAWGGQTPASAPSQRAPVEVAVPQGDAIRRAKLPGSRWLMRLWITVAVGGQPGSLTHPARTTERATDGWQVLRLD
jgi:hypothetical protein